MALEDMVKNDTSKGVLIGVAAVTAAFMLLPALSKIGRPVGRAALKTGAILFEKTREAAAEIGEVLEDLMAEAHAEVGKENVAQPQEATQAGEAVSKEVELKVE